MESVPTAHSPPRPSPSRPEPRSLGQNMAHTVGVFQALISFPLMIHAGVFTFWCLTLDANFTIYDFVYVYFLFSLSLCKSTFILLFHTFFGSFSQILIPAPPFFPFLLYIYLLIVCTTYFLLFPRDN